MLKPLELTLELTPSQLEDIAPEDLLMAYQGTDRRWQISTPQTIPLGGVVTQGAGAKVAAQVRKPGDYAAAVRYKIHPPRQSVKVNASLTLTVLKINPAAPDAGSGYNLADIVAVPATAWAVNGVAGGNEQLGRLIDTEKDSQKIYKAPASKPKPNPVRVTARVNDGGRTVTVAASVQVQDSKGWIENYYDVTISRTDNRARLSVDANVIYALDVTYAQAFPPTRGSGEAYFQLALRPGGFARARVVYTLSLSEPCVCTPNSGTITQDIRYSFIAGGEPKIVGGQGALVTATVQSDGSYKLRFSHGGVAVDGEYSYSFSETYPCGDRAARPPVNRNGTDTFVFGPATNTDDLTGSVKPNGPDRMTGMATLPIRATLPVKELSFAPQVGVNVPSWFLEYSPVDLTSPQRTSRVSPLEPSPASSGPPLPSLLRLPLLEPERVKPQC